MNWFGKGKKKPIIKDWSSHEVCLNKEEITFGLDHSPILVQFKDNLLAIATCTSIYIIDLLHDSLMLKLVFSSNIIYISFAKKFLFLIFTADGYLSCFDISKNDYLFQKLAVTEKVTCLDYQFDSDWILLGTQIGNVFACNIMNGRVSQRGVPHQIPESVNVIAIR